VRGLLATLDTASTLFPLSRPRRDQCQTVAPAPEGGGVTTYKCPSCTATFTRQASYADAAAVPGFINIRCDNCGRFFYGPDHLLKQPVDVSVLIRLDVEAGEVMTP
jgi:hypothetical protein